MFFSEKLKAVYRHQFSLGKTKATSLLPAILGCSCNAEPLSDLWRILY